MKKNIGSIDRLIRLIIAIILFIFAWWTDSLLIVLLAIFVLCEALFSWCFFYQLIGKNSCSLNKKNPMNSYPTIPSAKMDAQSQAFLNFMKALKTPPLETLPIERVRKDTELMTKSSSVKLASIQERQIAGPYGEIPVRLYIPDNSTSPLPVFITLHGGGWIFGSLDSHDSFCRDIAKQSNTLVVSVGYRLAPEYKYPSALNECYTVLEWTNKNIHHWSGDPNRIAIGGESSGGNLSAALALMARDKKGPHLYAQVLIYPVTRYGFDSPSYQRYAEGYFLTKKHMEWFWGLYLEKNSDGFLPYASPLLAKDLSKLPPTLLLLAEFDPLYDDALDYGKKLESAGVPVTFRSYPSIHAFIKFTDQLDIAKQAINDIAQFLIISFKEAK